MPQLLGCTERESWCGHGKVGHTGQQERITVINYNSSKI